MILKFGRTADAKYATEPLMPLIYFIQGCPCAHIIVLQFIYHAPRHASLAAAENPRVGAAVLVHAAVPPIDSQGP